MTVVTVDDLHTADDPEARLRWAANVAHVTAGNDLRRIIVKVPDRATNGIRVFRANDVARMLQKHGRVLEIGVTDGGTIVGAADLCKRRGEVAIWTGYAIGPWMPSDIVQRGLGGSETAAVRLAEEMAKMGYIVTLYGQFDSPGMVGDVLLRDFREFDPTQPLDAAIIFRDARPLDHRPNARFVALWLEDLPGLEGITPARMRNVDRVCAVSGWHRRAVLDYYPFLEESHVAACRNGIVHAWFEDAE